MYEQVYYIKYIYMQTFAILISASNIKSKYLSIHLALSLQGNLVGQAKVWPATPIKARLGRKGLKLPNHPNFDFKFDFKLSTFSWNLEF